MPELQFFLWGRLFEGGPALGLVLNLLIGGVALFAGAVVGIPLGAFRAMAPALVQAPVAIVLGLVRGTPILLLLLWVYLLIEVVLAWRLTPIVIGCIALSLYGATHISDIVRSGARAVTRVQLRAAQALGLGPIAIARWLVIPVACRVMIPALATFATTIFKDSSVCYVIGVVEIMQLAVLESGEHPAYILELYGFVALVFLTVNIVGMRIAASFERACAVPGTQMPGGAAVRA